MEFEMKALYKKDFCFQSNQFQDLSWEGR